MKKIMTAMVAAAALGAAAMEYVAVELGDKPVRIPYDGKMVELKIVSTDADAVVTANVVNVVSSYTNCVDIAVVTNGIGEISTVTNRWMGLKETNTYTNTIGRVTCENGVGRAPINRCILGGDMVFATGITNVGETVKATLVIEK